MERLPGDGQPPKRSDHTSIDKILQFFIGCFSSWIINFTVGGFLYGLLHVTTAVPLIAGVLMLSLNIVTFARLINSPLRYFAIGILTALVAPLLILGACAIALS